MIWLIPGIFIRTSIVRKKRLRYPPLKKRNGSGVAQSKSEKAAEFNGQFTDVFNKLEHNRVPLLDSSAPFMEDNVVTEEVVMQLLKGFKYSKVLGHDELHPRVLKQSATELCPISKSKKRTHFFFSSKYNHFASSIIAAVYCICVLT